jgi:hypothetical protein
VEFLYEEPTEVKERTFRAPTTFLVGKTQSALERISEFERKLLFLSHSPQLPPPPPPTSRALNNVLDLLYHISDFNHVKLLSHIFNLYQE